MFTGKLIQPAIDYVTHRKIAQIEILEGDYGEFFDNVDKDREYDVVIKPHKNKRSINANALFHKMVREISQALTPPISMTRCKNILMARYGVIEYMDDTELVPQAIKTNIPPDILLEQEGDHWKVSRSDGDLWFYIRLKPTHEYDTKQFSVLLDGTLEDAKELGICTVSEDEKLKAIECWGVELQERNKNDKR